MATDRAGLYGNAAYSILVLSTKKLYSSFLKRVFKVKVLKTLKISKDCHIKTCRSLKHLEEPMLFLSALK